MVDELAGKDDEALRLVAVECLEALEEEARELRRERGRRLVVVGAGGIVRDAGLGRVGRDEAKIRVLGVREELVEVDVGVDAARDGRYDALRVHLLAVLEAAQVERVEALLLVERLADEFAAADGLNEADLAVEAGLLVEAVEEVVDERAEEVALPELEDALRRILEEIPLVALLLKRCIAEFFHLENLPFFCWIGYA